MQSQVVFRVDGNRCQTKMPASLEKARLETSEEDYTLKNNLKQEQTML